MGHGLSQLFFILCKSKITELAMFTKNRLIILFTLLYLFIEIGFRALVNEHLRAPGVATDVTDMFVVLGRLISAIGFTVILFNLLKNNETVSGHPKKCIAGLYLSSFIVISIITSLALTWLPIETQMRAFYAHYYKTAAYYSSVENSKTPVNISEARLTTLPLLMITEINTTVQSLLLHFIIHRMTRILK